ncbi:hypothetical protein EVAR_78429_1 [Eumeta japonica]|uniref:Uncharacterized protein n=1 Tax=Eumeta variegata TaxID=151549 RepID=A0A4C1TY27_EUMVA|nr:hypothetical protein EVAR_78429_1 [Eumeta japonica]
MSGMENAVTRRPYNDRANHRDRLSRRRWRRDRYGVAHRLYYYRTLRLGVTYEKGVTLGNVTMSHRTRERPAECLASLSHSTMIGLPRAQH